MSHTPTPWKLSEEGIIAAQSATPATAGGAPNPALLRTPVIALPPVDYPDYSQFKTSDWDADAAHIVRCVNVHDQLVAALQYVRQFYQDNFDVMPVAFQTVDNELEKALAAA